MARYTAERNSYTPSTTNVDIAVTAGSAGIDVIMEAIVTGLGAASATNTQSLVRHTVNGITPVAITLSKNNPQSGSAVATAASSFSTPPTFSAANGPDLGINVFGGSKRWSVFDVREGWWLVGAAGAGGQEGSLTAKNGAGGGLQEASISFEEL